MLVTKGQPCKDLAVSHCGMHHRRQPLRRRSPVISLTSRLSSARPDNAFLSTDTRASFTSPVNRVIATPCTVGQPISATRMLAVVSVDGINAVTGETASADQNGYVLAPYQSFDILGWRKNLNEVAAFYFTQLPDSYAARTDRPNHVGVIGVAAFREWMTPPRPAITPHATPRSSTRRQESARIQPGGRVERR